MTPPNEPLQNVQTRIEELQNTIAQKEQAIKQRTRQLQNDLETELTPVELVRKHPLPSTLASFITGMVAGRGLKRLLAPARKKTRIKPCEAIQEAPEQPFEPEPAPAAPAHAGARGNVVREIGNELLQTGKDLAIHYLRGYLDAKIPGARRGTKEGGA